MVFASLIVMYHAISGDISDMSSINNLHILHAFWCLVRCQTGHAGECKLSESTFASLLDSLSSAPYPLHTGHNGVRLKLHRTLYLVLYLVKHWTYPMLLQTVQLTCFNRFSS
jgi:hypothetical protein